MTKLYRRPLPLQQRIADRIEYDKETGIAIWRPLPETCSYARGFNLRFAGKPIGSLTASGYLSVGFDNSMYRLHRLIIKLMLDIEPTYIDHVDGNRLNNRSKNLRPCNSNQSAANRRTNNSTGFKGVSADKAGRWRARAMYNGRSYFLGSFVSKLDAAMAARNARKLLHGVFATDRNQMPRTKNNK